MKFTAILAGLLLASPVYAAQESVPSIEATAPLEDLLQDQSFRKDYDNGLYDRRGGDFRIVSFSEYAYNPSDMSDYGLYVYVYNPDEDKAVDLTSSLNSIQIKSNVFGGDDFDKYHLNFVSRNGDWFYKFKVTLDDDTLNDSLQTRTYEVSGIELIGPGERNPTDYGVGIEYAFSGLAKGVNGQTESSLTCIQTDKETLELQTIGGYYRVNSSADGLTGSDMFYVCFAVPNSVLTRYGGITAVRYTYSDYKLSDLFVFTGSNVGGVLVTEEEALHQFATDQGKWGSGDFKSNNLLTGSQYSPYNLFISEEYRGALYKWTNAYVRGETIRDRFYEAEEAGTHLYNTELNPNPDVGPVEIKSSDRLHLEQVEPSKWWIGSWPIGGGDTELISDIKGIETLPTDGSVESYYVMDEDLPMVEDFIDDANENGRTPYIMRFAVEKYRVEPLWRMVNTQSKVNNGIRVREMHAIINFDIISVTFTGEDKTSTVLPVVSSPIDIFPDITVPGDFDAEHYDWVRLILIIIGVVIGMVALIGIIQIVNDYRKKHPKQPKVKKPARSDEGGEGDSSKAKKQ